ncbi:MAG: acyltransferase, partial [Flavisolibacter sp.]
MAIVEKIKSSPKLKRLVHWSITPARNPRPRFWIKLFVNPFFHKKGKNAVIRRYVRLDVFPWNKFELGTLSTIEDFTLINNGSGNVIIGDRVRVGVGSVILGPVTMGNGSGLGQN